MGLPRHVRCLYVDQLEGVDPGIDPVGVVVSADVAAQRAQRQAEALQAALECGGAAEAASALRALRLERLQARKHRREKCLPDHVLCLRKAGSLRPRIRRARPQDQVAQARQTAEHRSGERGLAARQDLVAAEARLAEAQSLQDSPAGPHELQGASQQLQARMRACACAWWRLWWQGVYCQLTLGAFLRRMS